MGGGAIPGLLASGWVRKHTEQVVKSKPINRTPAPSLFRS